MQDPTLRPLIELLLAVESMESRGLIVLEQVGETMLCEASDGGGYYVSIADELQDLREGDYWEELVDLRELMLPGGW